MIRTAWTLLPLVAVMDDAVGPPKIQPTELEDARTHVPYTAWLEASAGEPPLLWTATGLPPGLAMNPGGAITGVPLEKGTSDISVTVTDDRGRTDEVELLLDVKWAQNSIGCDRERSGTFDDVADTDFMVVDWDAEGGWTTIEIALPDPEVTSMYIEIGDAFFSVYQALPGTPEGDRNLEANYFRAFAFPGFPLVIDLGSFPADLESYRAYGQPIQLVVATNTPADWTASATCTTGPVIDLSSPAPVQVGDALTVNYSVHGDQSAVTWDLVGNLPPWATFAEDSGRITGIAEELGTWTYTLEATDEDGQSGAALSGFGVYEHLPIACDTNVVWSPHGYYSGSLSGYSDPDGYRVFELPLDGSVSGITAWLDVPDGGEVGVVAPGEPTYLSSAGSSYDFSPALLSMEITPQTWPPLGAHVDQGALHTIAAAFYDGSPDITFWLECDPLPRLNHAALPVVETGGSQMWPLDAIGGTGPYTWSAANLPPGVTLDPTGLLQSASPAAGTTTVDVTVTDSLGAETTTPLDLFVGEDAGCQGETALSCNSVYASDALLSGSSEVLCIETSAAEHELVVLTATPITAERLDVWTGDPAAGPSDTGRYLLAPRSYGADAGTIDQESNPPLWAYADQPIFVTVSASTGGSYELAVDCY